jgi:hypothetical protein
VKHRSGIAAAIACGAFSALLVTLPALADPTPSPSHQAQVEQHSKEVMPFDLNRTMHIFTPTNNGGVQTVMVHDGDPQQIALVRSHLRKEARAFAHGDFADPAAIHGNNMPGLSQLRAGAKRIAISYGAMANGASITYRTSDPSLIAAIHRWFAAQVHDHGAHAMMAH